MFNRKIKSKIFKVLERKFKKLKSIRNTKITSGETIFYKYHNSTQLESSFDIFFQNLSPIVVYEDHIDYKLKKMG